MIGAPDWCSQCLRATPRLVELDTRTGAVTVDGELIQRRFDHVDYGTRLRPLSPRGAQMVATRRARARARRPTA